MKLLLTNIDQAPLDTILTYFKVQRRDEQPERDWTLYFSPWHKDKKRVLRVSNGHRKGGLYASPLWEVPESTTDKVGYGAIALTARLMGLADTAENRRRIVETIVQVCGIHAPWLADEHRNGVSTLVDAQKEITLQTSADFSVEGLQALGCRVERLYKETATGKRIALQEDGMPVFQFSFGSGFGKSIRSTNFDVERIHRELGLYEVESYTTKCFWNDKLQVSRRRESHPLFPIFATLRIATDEEGNPKQWGEVLQPEWRGTEGKGCECRRFLFFGAGLDAYSVGTPIMADMTARLVMQGEFAKKAVAEVGTNEPLVTQKTVEEPDEEGKRVTKQVDIPEHEVKLTNIVLCSDALNAVCAYFALNSISASHKYNPHVQDIFYHVCWPLEGDKSLKGFGMTQMKKAASNLYILFGADEEGKRHAFRICKQNTFLKMASITDRLPEYFTVFRGGQLRAAADVRAFFTDYRMTEEEDMAFDSDLALMFLSFFTRALPIEPLVKKSTFDKKTGVLKDYEYRVDSACLWQFMATEGYCREVSPNSSNIIGRYIHRDGCFVQELDAKSIVAAAQDALRQYAQRQARPGTEDFRKMSNAIITSRDILESKASNLPVMKIDYRTGYGPKVDHFFYRNGALRITPDEIKLVPYNQIGFCVDKAEILPFDFKMPCARGEEPFSISENPEYRKRLKELENHRRDTDHYTQVEIQEEERRLQIWAQMHRWEFDFKGRPVKEWWEPLQVLRCFANEEHEEEERLQREGKEFSEEQNRALYARMANILYSLGRPLFRYRGGGTSYMPYITENSVSGNTKAEGGSGKSLFVNLFMGCSGKVYRVNSRNLRPDSDITLMLDKYEPRAHRVVHWEDWPNGVKIDPLYNYVTSGFEFRQRHKDTIRVPLAESPGHVISSNFQQTYEDPSSSGRVVPTGFSHRFNRGDVRKNKPQKKVSDVMPGLRDEPEEMNIDLRSQIGYINALAVQFCMMTTERVLPPMDELNERSQQKAMGNVFVEWAKNFFSQDHIFLCPIDIKTIFNEYVELCESSDDKKNKFSQQTFRKKLEEYCADNGYVCNPDCCYSNATERTKKYMRVKAWVKTTYFADESTWGIGRKKEIRELRQSETCLFFVRTETEANALTNDDVARLRKEFYNRPDPMPCIDPSTGEPYVLTDEDRLDWEVYMLKRQGNYTKANKLVAEAQGGTAATGLEKKEEAKKGEVMPETELPF